MRIMREDGSTSKSVDRIEYEATLRKFELNQVVQLLLTLFTYGYWLPVWIALEYLVCYRQDKYTDSLFN